MVQLALPLAGEQLLRIVVSLVDTFMLSTYCEEAVAGVGLVAQYIFFLQILFNIVVIGSSIVLAQYLGAERSKEELNNIAKASVIMVLLLAIVLTLAVFFGTPLLLGLYKLEDSVRSFASEYFLIFGGAGAIFNAVSLLQSSILRCYGYTRQTLVVTLVANLINVVGNALSLYGWFGLPVLGVPGVAGASLLSTAVSCVILGFMIKRRKDICFNLEKLFSVP